MKEAVSASWEGFDPLPVQMASTVLTTIVPLYCSNGRPEPALNYYSSNLKHGGGDDDRRVGDFGNGCHRLRPRRWVR